MGEAALVRCDEVIATPRRMGAGLLGQQEWGLQGRFGCPPQIGGSSRGPAGVLFFAWAPIFSYRGSSRGPAGVALRCLKFKFFSGNKQYPLDLNLTIQETNTIHVLSLPPFISLGP